MSKRFYFLYSSVLLILCFQLAGFHWRDQVQAGQVVSDQFQSDLTTFTTTLKKLHTAIEKAAPSEADLHKVQELFLECRKQFKKTEYLLEYFHPEAVKDYINGAPLPHLERKAPELVVLEPEGMQVIDEMLFADAALQEKKSVLEQIHKVTVQLKRLAAYQKGIRITDRHIFEACRYELIRIFTLGVTGFDTPGSVNALKDAYVAMQSIERAMKPYMKRMENIPLAEQLRQATAYLDTHQDFENFDRLYFLKQYINPLYKQLYEAQKALHIETIDEVTDVTQSVNYYSTSLFAPDFLNPFYYSGLNAKTFRKEQVTLGRFLFFDPILSANNKRACASCHAPEKAFADGLAKSTSFDKKGTVARNAPGLIDAVYADRYFYDLRADKLEKQMEHVVFSKQEFNTDFQTIVHKIERNEAYKQLFREAYPHIGKHNVSQYTITNAINTYIQSLQSFNSPFDRYVRNESDTLDEAVKKGFNLFMGKASCGTCHFAPVFNGSVPPFYKESESEVLGVPADKDTLKPTPDSDPGRIGNRMPKEHAAFYRNSFKTPTVRNSAHTGPYMHNGVYDSLEEVVDFYNRGGGTGLGLDVPNQTLPPDPLELTKEEQAALVAFMQALSDTSGLTSRPLTLPGSNKDGTFSQRAIGGEY